MKHDIGGIVAIIAYVGLLCCAIRCMWEDGVFKRKDE